MDAGTVWIMQYGYGAIFVLLMLGIVGLPVPGLFRARHSTFHSVRGWLVEVAAGRVCALRL